MEQVEKTDRYSSFVDYIFRVKESNKGSRARLRRADNRNTQETAYEFLAPFVDLEAVGKLQAYALIAAAIASDDAKTNGTGYFGKALRSGAKAGKESAADKKLLDGKDHSDPMQARLRRLLSCSGTQEACLVVRPMLTLIQSRGQSGLDYARLLRQLIDFEWWPERVKAQWAKEYFGAPGADQGIHKDSAS